MILHKKTEKSSVAPVHPGKVVRRRRIFTLFFAQECTRQTEPRRPISPSRLSGLGFRRKTRGRFTAPHIVLAHRSFALWNALKFSYSPHFHSIFRPFIHTIRKILSYGFKFSPHTGQDGSVSFFFPRTRRGYFFPPAAKDAIGVADGQTQAATPPPGGLAFRLRKKEPRRMGGGWGRIAKTMARGRMGISGPRAALPGKHLRGGSGGG